MAAARRVVGSTVDWAAFVKRVPPEQISMFNTFKAKSDGYLRKVSELPDSLPAINWAHYESRVKVPGLVDGFKKQYEGLQIQYPADKYTQAVDEQEKRTEVEVAEFVKQSEARIANMKVELAKYQSMIPPEEMTMEEFYVAFPDQAIDPFDRPTLWPHTPEVELEHLAKLKAERDQQEH